MKRTAATDITTLYVQKLRVQKGKKKNSYTVCPLCSKPLQRIDHHIINVHHIADWKSVIYPNPTGGSSDSDQSEDLFLTLEKTDEDEESDDGTYEDEESDDGKGEDEESDDGTHSEARDESSGRPTPDKEAAGDDDDETVDYNPYDRTDPENEQSEKEESDDESDDSWHPDNESTEDDDSWHPDNETRLCDELSATVVDFVEWMKSREGGQYAQKTAEIYQKRCESVFTFLGGEVESLTKYKLLVKENGFLDKMCEKYKPATVRTHLYALQLFFSVHSNQFHCTRNL